MKKISLNELMGGSAEKIKERKISLNDLPDLLGERMPKMEYSPVGRYRLTQALRNRFGDNYRNLPGMSEVLQEFDKEAEFNIAIQKMKLIKAGK